MADYQSIRVTGARAAQIDEGLRAHMTKVYGQMAVGMGLTGAVAWAVGSNDAMLGAIFGSPLKWVVMLAPLAFVFFYSFTCNQGSYCFFLS